MGSLVQAVKEIGLTPVVVLLLLIFQFRTIIRLERENERLLTIVLKLTGGHPDEDRT
jgi:hypothetical protein